METSLVYITAPDRACASTIAEALVADNLAACVNIMGEIRSVYRWQGEICSEPEIALIAKTSPSAFNALSSRVKALHPYETPCIIEIPITNGLPAFLDWITSNVRLP